MKLLSNAWRLSLAVALLAFSPVVADTGDGVLLWMVYDNWDPDSPHVPDTSPTDLKFIDQLRSRPGDLPVNGARLRVAGTDAYLSIYASGSNKLYDDDLLPIAPDPQNEIFSQAGPVYSYFGVYDSPEYSFLVELGHWDGNEWLVMAVSQMATHEQLVEGGWTTDNLQNYPRQGPWAPSFVVPEPSGGLLLLLGASLLALRRRRQA